MESVYLLIPVSVLLVFGIAIAFWWSVRSGQFDDLEGPGLSVVVDDDNPRAARPEPAAGPRSAAWPVWGRVGRSQVLGGLSARII